MNKLYKLPKLESNRNESYFRVFSIVIVVLILGLIIALIFTGESIMSGKVMQNCLDNGYTEDYCEMMMN